jgi:hypothetical protein
MRRKSGREDTRAWPGHVLPPTGRRPERASSFEPHAASDPGAPSLAATVIERPNLTRSPEMSSAPVAGRRLGATVVEWRRRRASL